MSTKRQYLLAVVAATQICQIASSDSMTASADPAPTVTRRLSNSFRSSEPTEMRLPGGVQYLSQMNFQTRNSVSLYGNAKNPTILRLPADATCQGALFQWLNAKNVVIKDVTIDLNGTNSEGRFCAAINITGGSNFRIENVHVIHAGTGRWLLLSINGSKDGTVTNSSFEANSSQTMQNQGLNVSASFGKATGWSFIGNKFVNTGVALSGSDVKFCNNQIENWGYGAGVSVGKNTSDHVLICANRIGNSGRNRDGDGIFPNGIESWGRFVTIMHNNISNVAANGIYIGGNNTAVCANTIRGAGERSDGAGAPGIQVGYVSPTSNGDGAVIVGNDVSNGPGGATIVGFADMPNTMGVILKNNKFSGSLAPTRIRGGSKEAPPSLDPHC